MKIHKNEKYFWLTNLIAFILGFILYLNIFEANYKTWSATFISIGLILFIISINSFEVHDKSMYSKLLILTYNIPAVLFTSIPQSYLTIEGFGITDNQSFGVQFFALLYLTAPLFITTINFYFIQIRSLKKYLIMILLYYITYIIVVIPLFQWLQWVRID